MKGKYKGKIVNKESEALAVLKQTIFHYTLGCLTTGEEKAFKVIETKLKDAEKLRQINCELLEQKNTLREEREKYKRAIEIIKKTWGSRILNDLQEGFILGSPYAILPPKEEIELLKGVLEK